MSWRACLGKLDLMWRIVLTAAAALLARAGSGGWASEPAQAFLDGLRERKYFDIALEYLEAAANNPAVPAAFKETIAYEKGVTLVQGARSQPDLVLREAQLDEAQKALQAFLADQSSSVLYGQRPQPARQGDGRAGDGPHRTLEEGRTRREAEPAEAGPRSVSARRPRCLPAWSRSCRTKLKSYPAALDEKTDAKRIEERDRYRQDLLQSQLLVAATREETADAITAGTKEWTDTLNAAAAAYQKVYENYRTRLAGLYAQMYQGRCLQKLGKHKEATAIFKLLLANPDTPIAFSRAEAARPWPWPSIRGWPRSLYPEVHQPGAASDRFGQAGRSAQRRDARAAAGGRPGQPGVRRSAQVAEPPRSADSQAADRRPQSRAVRQPYSERLSGSGPPAAAGAVGQRQRDRARGPSPRRSSMPRTPPARRSTRCRRRSS